MMLKSLRIWFCSAVAFALVTASCASDTEPTLTAAMCRADTACEAYGDCGLTADGVCGPMSTDDCAGAAEVCGDRGLCSYSEGQCVATSDAACGASRNCKRYGFCHLSQSGDHCIATMHEDCDNSDICLATKECKLNAGLGTCQNHGGH